jgi:hypothetical protein
MRRIIRRIETMKIVPPEHTPAKHPVKPTLNRPQAAAGPTFGQILDQVAEQQPGPVRQPANSMAIQRPPIFPSNPGAAARDASIQVEASLDALDAYCSALLDPQTSLRDMAPLMAGLTAAQQALDEKLSDLPMDDPLHQIGEQTRSIIVTEKARFNSGIYN